MSTGNPGETREFPVAKKGKFFNITKRRAEYVFGKGLYFP
jgi:hypothetical protein